MKVLVLLGPDTDEVDPIELRSLLRHYEEQSGNKITEVELKHTNKKLGVSLSYVSTGEAMNFSNCLRAPVFDRRGKGERKRNRKDRWK